MQTTIISLTDQTNELVLNIDEEFWESVHFVAFYKQLVEIKMKNGTPHRFLHYWAYEVIQKDNHTEEQKKNIYKLEGCNYRFAKDDKDFEKWLYDESNKRELLLF